MHISSFVRTMLVVSAITIWCGVFVFVGSAAAQSITCTGTQGPLIDAFGNECGSTVATGAQGPSTATATASGPTTPLSSSATSAASNNSSAISNANVASGAEAEASNSSTANASAQDGSGATAIASNSGTANASAQDDSGDAAFASNSGTANSSAQNDSGADATAVGSGTATATASGDSSASASTTGNGNAFADAVNDSTASATVTTANGFACAYANNGSFADAFDTSAPICTGPDAVVVSSAGSCGPVQDSPCALELQNYFSNANTTGGQAFVNITAPLEGIPTASTAPARAGETCAMIYVFNTEQSMQACCGCPLTADGLLTLSISSSLAGNPVALGQIVHDGSIRIIPSLPNATPRPAGASLPAYEGCDSATGVCCDPTAASTGNQLIPGSKLVAWGDHIQNTQITEKKFEANAPTPEELNDGLPGACAAITRLGSGQGDCICPSGS
jgi:hypothetical protein